MAKKPSTQKMSLHDISLLIYRLERGARSPTVRDALRRDIKLVIRVVDALLVHDQPWPLDISDDALGRAGTA
jgi:hypothetical protein